MILLLLKETNSSNHERVQGFILVHTPTAFSRILLLVLLGQVGAEEDKLTKKKAKKEKHKQKRKKQNEQRNNNKNNTVTNIQYYKYKRMYRSISL